MFTDCKANVTALRNGLSWATNAKRKYARIWHSIFHCLDDQGTDNEWLVWSPAHTPKNAIGRRLRSDGKTMTCADWLGNHAADLLAKAAHRLHLLIGDVQFPRVCALTGLHILARCLLDLQLALLGLNLYELALA